jgi:hypothetical protein
LIQTLRTIALPLFFLLLSLPGLVYSQQAPGIEWQKCYGGSNGDIANCIILATDGGYAIAGYTNSKDGDLSKNHGGLEPSEVWVIKLNSSGTIEWQTSIGGSSGDGANSIVRTFDGGYAVAGYTTSIDGDVSGYHGGNDVWIIKLSSSGKIEWQKCLGGSRVEWANSIVQTFDSGYAIAGFTNSFDGEVSGYHQPNGGESHDAWIAKLNSFGDIEWQKCIGGTSEDRANSIIQTFDSGYAVAGQTISMDGDVLLHREENDQWVIKLNSSGSIEWQKYLGDSGISSDEGAYSIMQTSDSGYAVAGSQIFKLNSAGEIKWQNNDVYGNSIIQTSDKGFIAAGAGITKITSSGKMEWHKYYGGSNNNGARSIVQNSDGSYVFAGYTNSSDGDVSGNHGSFDVWVVKLGASSSVHSNPTSISGGLTLFTYPNPAIKNITLRYDLPKPSPVEISIYNVLGERLQEISTRQEEESGHHELALDLSSFPTGSYYLTVKACGLSETAVVQLLK